MHVEDNGYFSKQVENQKCLGELRWKTCRGSLGEKFDKTTLLNTCNPILMVTILKVLREQFTGDDQRKTGLVPKTSLEWEQISKERGGLGDTNDGYLPEDLVLIASPDSCEGSWHNQSPGEELTRGDR